MDLKIPHHVQVGLHNFHQLLQLFQNSGYFGALKVKRDREGQGRYVTLSTLQKNYLTPVKSIIS